MNSLGSGRIVPPGGDAESSGSARRSRVTRTACLATSVCQSQLASASLYGLGDTPTQNCLHSTTTRGSTAPPVPPTCPTVQLAVHALTSSLSPPPKPSNSRRLASIFDMIGSIPPRRSRSVGTSMASPTVISAWTGPWRRTLPVRSSSKRAARRALPSN